MPGKNDVNGEEKWKIMTSRTVIRRTDTGWGRVGHPTRSPKKSPVTSVSPTADFRCVSSVLQVCLLQWCWWEPENLTIPLTVFQVVHGKWLFTREGMLPVLLLPSPCKKLRPIVRGNKNPSLDTASEIVPEDAKWPQKEDYTTLRAWHGGRAATVVLNSYVLI